MQSEEVVRQGRLEVQHESSRTTSHRGRRNTPDRRLAVSVAEAASLLGISRSFAYELARRGELPAVRLGRRLVVPVIGLEAMMGIREVGESMQMDAL